MFKKLDKLILMFICLVIAFLLASPHLFADAKTSTFGSPNSSGVYQLETYYDTSSGNEYIHFQRARKAFYEVATTNDTVTSDESGKTFFANITTGTITFTLPTAEAGMLYTFTSIRGNATSGQGRVYIAPQSTDTLIGCVNSSATSTFSAGDKLYSPEATGDSVTLVSPSDNNWACINRVGTWVDGN